MEDTVQLDKALRSMQDRVIGLFRPRYYPADHYIPVIYDKDGTLVCIEIGPLLGLQTLTIGKEAGRYVPFPREKVSTGAGINDWEFADQTLSSIMKEPLEFHQWYKDNVYPGK